MCVCVCVRVCGVCMSICVNVKWMRQNIGLVSQESVLFATTIAGVGACVCVRVCACVCMCVCVYVFGPPVAGDVGLHLHLRAAVGVTPTREDVVQQHAGHLEDICFNS